MHVEPLAHVPTGVTIRWSRALDVLYPEHLRGPCGTVTVDVGICTGRLVVQLVEGDAWLYLRDLPAHAADEVRFAEHWAYRAWRDQRDREQAAADCERAASIAFDLRH